MTIVFYIKILLSTIFLISSVAKLLNLKSFEKTLSALGFSGFLLQIAKYIVPIVELAVAPLLLWHKTASYAAVIVLLLCVGFTYSIVKSLRSNKTIACSCFGNFTNEKLSWTSLLRVVVIAAMSVYILVAGNNGEQLHIANVILGFVASIGIVTIHILANILLDFRKQQRLAKG